MKKSKILVLGSLAFDYIMGFKEKFINAVSINHETEEFQSTITVDSRHQHFGGTAGNIAYNLGLLNIVNISLLGSVGIDFESLKYKEHITQFENIELRVDVHDDLFTAACYIVNDTQSNQMIVFHGGALDRSKDINIEKKIINAEDYAIAINSTQSVDAMTYFADQLFNLNIPAIFDPGQVTPLFSKELLLDIIKKSEFLIGNTYEINQIKNKIGLAENELIEIVKAIIITRGGKGSELIYKDEEQKISRVDIPIGTPEKIEDTTGAGDGYRAGFLTGLTLDMTLLDSCRLGSIIGSFVVETNGAQTHKFNFERVRMRFINTFGYIPSEIEKS